MKVDHKGRCRLHVINRTGVETVVTLDVAENTRCALCFVQSRVQDCIVVRPSKDTCLENVTAIMYIFTRTHIYVYKQREIHIHICIRIHIYVYVFMYLHI